MILVDTGPLVALFDPADRDHQVCREILQNIIEPLYTTEAVVTEVLHLLNGKSKGAENFKLFLLEGYLALLSLDRVGLQRCFELMDKYVDLPMDFADATLVRSAELLKTTNILTLDLRDFYLYKIKKGHRYYPVDLIGYEKLSVSF